MKRRLAMLLALLLAAALFSCNNAVPQKEDTDKDPSAQEKDPGQGEVPAGEQEIDFNLAEIMDGTTTDIRYTDLSPAQKEALVAEGREQGVEVTFNPDGSTTFYVAEEGFKTTQKADGTWEAEGADGLYAVTGKWPDNDFTRLLPPPDFGTVQSASSEGNVFSALLADVTQGEARLYAEKLQEAGFTVDAEESPEIAGADLYTFTAKNAGGAEVSVSYTYAVLAIELTLA